MSQERNVNISEEDPYVQETVFPISRSSTEENLEKEAIAYERGRFSNSFQYLCTCVSYAIGFSNLWRFPYLCYKNGGGAFLIPYAISLFVAGMPMMYMEMAMGQFSSQGPITVWRCSPLFEGIGWGQIIVAFYVTLFYSVLSSHSLLYLILSMRKHLLWKKCGNEWNDADMCFEPSANDTHTYRKSGLELPSEGFWYNYVLEDTGTIRNLGYPQWKGLLCLVATWLVCTGVLAKGVKSMGKAMYFIALYPYVAITILVMYGYSLDGAAEGIIFYLLPDFSRLLDITVWSDAATQIFFSLGICQGSLLTMSSFNNFRDNVRRNAVTVSIINCATSFYLGFAIFTIVGFLSKQYSIELDKIVTTGSSLVFIVYPTGLAELPVSPLWSCIFFLMMFIVGVGSMIGCFATVMEPLSDRFETLQRHQIKFRVIACFVGFGCCVPMMCQGGFHILDLLNTYGGGVNLLFLAIVEIVAVAYFYGIDRLVEDIKMMREEEKKVARGGGGGEATATTETEDENDNAKKTTKETSKRRSRKCGGCGGCPCCSVCGPGDYWVVFWKYLTPIYLLFVSILWILSYSRATGAEDNSPQWAFSLGWFFSVAPLVPLPVIALIVWCRMSDTGVGLILATKPMPTWGPVLPENRTGRYAEDLKVKDEDELLQSVETRVRKKDRLKKSKFRVSRTIEHSPLEPRFHDKFTKRGLMKRRMVPDVSDDRTDDA